MLPMTRVAPIEASAATGKRTALTILRLGLQGAGLCLVAVGGGAPVGGDPVAGQGCGVDRDLIEDGISEQSVGTPADIEGVGRLLGDRCEGDRTIQLAVDKELRGRPVVSRGYVVPGM